MFHEAWYRVKQKHVYMSGVSNKVSKVRNKEFSSKLKSIYSNKEFKI